MNGVPMPATFFGHGNPMNAIAENVYGKKWHAIGRGLPKPKAVLTISAHWYVEETAVTAMAQPRTIHDFGGFPRELNEVHVVRACARLSGSRRASRATEHR